MNDIGRLCQLCAFCCDGTLFSHVGLVDDEVERMRGFRLPLIEEPGKQTKLRQRCEALGDGTRCGIYDERPVLCGHYECQLATAYREDEVSFDEAEATVRRIRADLVALENSLPAGVSGFRWRTRAASVDDRLTDEQRAEITRIEAALARHFLGRRG